MRVLASLLVVGVCTTLVPTLPVQAQCGRSAPSEADTPLAGDASTLSATPCSVAEPSGLEARFDVDEPSNTFVVSLRYRPDAAGGERPELRSISLLPDLPEDACTGPLADARTDALELTSSWTSMACRRPENEAVLVLVDTDVGDFHRTVAPRSTPPPTPQQVLAALPAGIVLGWYSGEPIPEGFALCDGTDDLPDLVGRFPLGTDDPMEIGTRTGSATHEHWAGHLRAESPRVGGASTDGWSATGVDRVGTPQTTGLEHTHAVRGSVDPASNIPPSTRVMFICKR